MYSVDAIGDTAGHVWRLLQVQGKISLSAVERGVTAPRPVVHMAIGWLAREGKVELQREGRVSWIWLRGEEAG